MRRSTTLSSSRKPGFNFGLVLEHVETRGAYRPFFSAAISAASSTTPPRVEFTRIAVGFIFASSAAPIR